MPSGSPCNVLMIYPRFGEGTFWNFAAACKIFNARYPTAPLGLITVAAQLPTEWTIRLVDRNTEALAELQKIAVHDSTLVDQARRYAYGVRSRVNVRRLPSTQSERSLQVLFAFEDRGIRWRVAAHQELSNECARRQPSAVGFCT
jgi:hypothetical protein